MLFRSLHDSRAPIGEHDRIVGLDLLDKLIAIDQQPIGRTPRSNPATYTKAFDHIRALFAELPEARTYGYKPGRFSFNVKGGLAGELPVVERHDARLERVDLLDRLAVTLQQPFVAAAEDPGEKVLDHSVAG